MSTKESKKEMARFDTRLSSDQKRFFERAAVIGGYRSLTDFVISTVQEKAKLIITEREKVIASRRDSEIFFDALLNSEKPNEELSDAMKQYYNLTSE